jgi:hypothetical protein
MHEQGWVRCRARRAEGATRCPNPVHGRPLLLLLLPIQKQESNTTSNIPWKPPFLPSLFPDSASVWSQRKKQSCRSLRGEQHCFKDPELTRTRLEDMELRKREPQTEICSPIARRLKLHFLFSISLKPVHYLINRFHHCVDLQ